MDKGLVCFHYDFRSPYAYLAAKRLDVLTTRGLRIEWAPASIDVLLNLQAQREPWAAYQDPLAPPKRAHLFADIARLSNFWRIPLLPPRPLRPRSIDAMSIATLLSESNVEHSAFRAKAFATI